VGEKYYILRNRLIYELLLLSLSLFYNFSRFEAHTLLREHDIIEFAGIFSLWRRRK
jgi:hypothetical protein